MQNEFQAFCRAQDAALYMLDGKITPIEISDKLIPDEMMRGITELSKQNMNISGYQKHFRTGSVE